MRQDAGLNALQLAAAAGWHRTKVSKIEHASRPPNADDIRTWCRACGAEVQAADLIASLRAVEGAYLEYRRLLRAGLRRVQTDRRPLYDQTRFLRVYCSQVIPGLLQTPAYVTELLSQIAVHHGIPTDVPEAVSARVDRQRILREGDHRFAFVIEESVLRYRLGDAETMAGQLGHLLTAMSLPSVSLGIIPFSESRECWPLENFTMFDKEMVQVELLSAQVTMKTPSEVAHYVKAFEHFSAMAVTGTRARALITSALESLG